MIKPLLLKQLKEAFAKGSGLKILAEKNNLSYPSILKKAKLENWPTEEIQKQEQKQQQLQKTNIVQPEEKAKDYQERMAALVHEKTLPTLEQMSPQSLLDNAKEIETLDKVARRNFGLDQQSQNGGNGPTLNIAILAQGLEAFTNQPKEKIVEVQTSSTQAIALEADTTTSPPIEKQNEKAKRVRKKVSK